MQQGLASSDPVSNVRHIALVSGGHAGCFSPPAGLMRPFVILVRVGTSDVLPPGPRVASHFRAGPLHHLLHLIPHSASLSRFVSLFLIIFLSLSLIDTHTRTCVSVCQAIFKIICCFLFFFRTKLIT